MKQAQSETSRNHPAGSWWTGDPTVLRQRRRTDRPLSAGTLELHESSAWSFGQILVAVLAGIWFIVTLPFRLIFWLIAWAGRLTAVLLGFSLMVVGIALWAGPLFFLGIPLFLVGLVLTLRCLD
jgi:hypothetical protein